MSSITLESESLQRSDDPDMRNAETALQRAAKFARDKARQFGHGIIVYRNGETVELPVINLCEQQLGSLR